MEPSSRDTPESALREALLRRDQRGFEALLAAGADPDARDGAGDPILHVAAACLELWAVALLLRHGADATRRDARGRTPSEAVPLNPSLSPFEMADAEEIVARLDRAAAARSDGASAGSSLSHGRSVIE